MHLFIRPTYQQAQQFLDREDYDEDNYEDAVLFEQGWQTECIEIEDDEECNIPEGYEAFKENGEPYYGRAPHKMKCDRFPKDMEANRWA